MSTHQGAAKRSPVSLSTYYRQSLEAEQILRLQVSLERKGYALLRHHEDQLITRGAPTALLTDPSDLQQARELEWLERQTQFSPPLLAYLADTPPAPTQAATPGVTVVRSNPAQDRVLRLRPSVLQVVAGPPGTGKTQTIINLIASAVCDGQTVLFISKNNTAVDNVCEAFTRQELFPGILRLGNRDFRERTVAYIKQVLAGLEKGLPLPGDRAAFQAEGAALIRQIARLEEELAEVQRPLPLRHRPGGPDHRRSTGSCRSG